MPNAIKVENLGKRYTIGRGGPKQVGRYRTFRESLGSVPAALMRRIRSGLDGERSEEFWALREVDLAIEPGEVVGIIGRNGAGKSTLLKVLSRITKPSVGRVELHGRVGSLLEVGTGFHPELTGRENIYLNGAILGMSRREIDRKFDEIVDFAAIETFLDTPVKRYSSGMYVRLAFAVAAHLEPEIMLVDEVLAVGDLHFQRKCLDKMDDVARGGRTVLLVSHNMAAIESLCSRVLLINGGRLVHDGDAAEVIRSYTELSRQLATVPINDRTDRRGEGIARVVHIEIQDLKGTERVSLPMGECLRVVLRIRVERPLPAVCIGLIFETHNGQRVFGARSSVADRHQLLEPGVTTVTCEIPAPTLTTGRYSIQVVVRDEGDYYDIVDHATTFEITAADVFGTGRPPIPFDGPSFVHSNWSVGAPVETIAPDRQMGLSAVWAAPAFETESTGPRGQRATAESLTRPRPLRPTFAKSLPPPREELLFSIRRSLKRLMFSSIDRGWFGLRPLRTHVVVCGFARSGSTLLQLMIETCISDVQPFGQEASALAAAQYSLRNHTYMVTKDPIDVFFVDEIRAFYATRQANVRFILTVRDPRSILTSIHHGQSYDRPDEYYEHPSRLGAHYDHVRYAQQFDDVVTVEYEDLIRRTPDVQRKLTEFIGWHVHLPFDRFHTAASPEFDGTALNGLRPLDPSRLDAWRQEKHRRRIRQVLRELPELPDYLIEMGYESDTSWMRDYLDDFDLGRSGLQMQDRCGDSF